MTNFSKLVLKMTEYEGGCVERVNHFLKVFAFAKTIAEGEDVDDATKEILEARRYYARHRHPSVL